MRLFREKAEQIIPTGEKSYVLSHNGFIRQNFGLRRTRLDKWEVDIPYIQETIQYLTQCRGRVYHHLILVTENENTAMKVAAYLKVHAYDFADDLEELDDFYDYDDEDDRNKVIRVLNFNSQDNEERLAPNVTNKYVNLLQEVSSNDMVLFTGLTNRNEISRKAEVIAACPAEVTCICISPEQMAAPWVQELRINVPCGILKLTEPDHSCLEKILAKLLEGEEYKLAKTLSPGKLIHRICKKRGTMFREEDIAWYLDQAAEKLGKENDGDRLMREKHFSELFPEEQTSLEKLNAMTGLANLKRIAKEIVAITKEEMRNEKLGVLHKNMIFVGNPGTGKTTCARLLADIMAEEGNTNASFVIAERKDLIGKYVGHTAPRVAGKFEEARGGVLFVDEAGFFLNERSGGFVTEAMKEFIRYMELYPDVTVIFALYFDEVDEFLGLDSGLSSRISRFVKFEDYSTEELTKMILNLLKEKGYQTDENAAGTISGVITQIRKDKRKQFGNAREARTLAESIIVTAAMRKYQSKEHRNLILSRDVIEGYERLKTENETKRAFGFQKQAENLTKVCCGY